MRQLKKILIIFIEWLGFVHRHRPYINGDRNRVHFSNKNDEKAFYTASAGTLLNTRSGNIYIGRNVMFGHEVQILAGTHEHVVRDPLEIKKTPSSGCDIYIRDGVWLTSRVIVLCGITIGENTTVLPNSVVDKDLPPNVIAGGVPAKVIRDKC